MPDNERIRLINGSAAQPAGPSAATCHGPPAQDVSADARPTSSSRMAPRSAAAQVAPRIHDDHGGLVSANVHHRAPRAARQRTMNAAGPVLDFPRGCEPDECARAAVEARVARPPERQHRARDPQSRRRDESRRAVAGGIRRADRRRSSADRDHPTHSERVSHIIDNVLQLVAARVEPAGEASSSEAVAR